MTDPGAQDRRRRRVLVGLALIFFAPLGLAFYLYYAHAGWHPGGRVNTGVLIEPARPLPAASFLNGKWTLLLVESGACEAACRARLYDTRQVRLALDRDMKRVQRVLIAEGGCCDAEFLHDQHPDLDLIQRGAAAPVLALLPQDNAGAARAPRVYLIDPLGNLMMFYPTGAKPKGMLEDLKRLLRLSSIG